MSLVLIYIYFRVYTYSVQNNILRYETLMRLFIKSPSVCTSQEFFIYNYYHKGRILRRVSYENLQGTEYSVRTAMLYTKTEFCSEIAELSGQLRGQTVKVQTPSLHSTRNMQCIPTMLRTVL